MVLTGRCICGSKYWHRRHQLTITRGGCSDPKANRSVMSLFDAIVVCLMLFNTSIEVMVGVTNEEVLEIGQSPSKSSMGHKNVVAYVPRAQYKRHSLLAVKY
ncbi:hypothetical protein IFM89_011067 [Coptis chinensis]|uniref:Uncharacterized protein n=1 Tax=Coptis chinensis TaxID=261450 RepID=A0A835M8I6_9MAGN|nr:hypothetical protein IFM89_011067 [Coptis chinensis]